MRTTEECGKASNSRIWGAGNHNTWDCGGSCLKLDSSLKMPNLIGKQVFFKFADTGSSDWNWLVLQNLTVTNAQFVSDKCSSAGE